MINSELTPGHLDKYLASQTPVERELQRIFCKRERLIILDIGACEGEESIRYSHLFPKARIFTFEPLPANQRLIAVNFERYNIQNTEVVPIALSDHTGTSEFYISSGTPPVAFAGDNWNYGNKSSSLLPPASKEPMFGWLYFDSKITVATEKLDDFASRKSIRHIDFIHMDVQGAEHLVLAGATHMLSRTTALWLEVSEKELYAGQNLRKEMEKKLRAAGFIKALNLQREVEGDQLHVNSRAIRTWPYLVVRNLVNFWRKNKNPN